ncbi:Major facilitator protein [Dioscorea alata]|uniref:Major facilitator protein n=1 Tax=Dioscorea alata TaxID=55571 RepID=A0ACB7VLK8_DIOAL|nr:Major facilitator protein [Dioscorea alata]
MDSSEKEDLVNHSLPSSSDHHYHHHHHQQQQQQKSTSNLKGFITMIMSLIWQPFQWLSMLCRELNTSFVLGVLLVYGVSQGFAGSFFRVVTDFYWKDVQKLQPSAVQMFMGFYYIPLIMKPIWGLLTDVFPISGYRRRPYFVIAGMIGAGTSIIIATHEKLSIPAALLCLVGMVAAVAIADVTIDACIARNSIERPELAADMQSLCGFVSSIGALVGYSTSGVFVHKLGPQAALGLMAIPALLLILLGFVIFELKASLHPSEKKNALDKAMVAVKGMGRTVRCAQVWKPSLYMFLSLALSFSTHEGHFYWYTSAKGGPAFSQEFIGIIYAIGAIASIVGVIIYHKFLKEYPFRKLLFYVQILYGVSGMLDLAFVLRLNLRLHLADSLFIIIEECFSRIIGRVRWMPMMVLSTRLCPLGIEGSFFALLMCIDSVGSLLSKIVGALVLHALHVTRTDFDNLWLAVLIRNLLRFGILGLIFLVPDVNQNEVLISEEVVKVHDVGDEEMESLQLVRMEGREQVVEI